MALEGHALSGTKICFAGLLLGVAALAQQPATPDAGTLAGNAYTNNFFRFTYTFPSGWSVRTGETDAQRGKSAGSVLLYVTKATGSYSMVAITYQDLAGKRWLESEYLDALQAATKDAHPIGARSLYTLGGRGFMRQDFEITSGAHYMAYVAGIARGYGLSFAVHADSQPELKDLVQTVTDAKFAPDWSSGVPAGEGCAGSSEASGRRVMRIRVSAGVAEGLLVKKVTPKYPVEARQKHIQGLVVLTALLGCDGSVRQLAVVSGPAALVDTVLEAVPRWQYKPYMLNGQSVEVETHIVVSFELRG